MATTARSTTFLHATPIGRVSRVTKMIVSDLMVGLACHGWAMTGCHPDGPQPTNWKEADLDILLPVNCPAAVAAEGGDR